MSTKPSLPPKTLFKDYNLKPLKRLGQHFLVSKTALAQIIQAAELSQKDIVLEIGPGLGVLTRPMAQEAKRVVAVEKDKKLVRILQATLKKNGIKNIEILEGDILSPDLFSYFRKKLLFRNQYKVVANLPYNIATAVIMRFLEEKIPPKLITVLVQKEVAQRICAHPPEMKKLAVFCQFYSQPKIVAYIPRTAFWPQPKVDSAILKIKPKTTLGLTSAKLKLFYKIVRAGFSQPRKQLGNNFNKVLGLQRSEIEKWLPKNNIQPNQRAETLSVNDWKNLSKSYPQG